jgi:hydroxyacylglutathione hydrolase
MLFKRIESEGLAHYSYLLGDTGEAVVIDPRRDIDVYLAAEKTGYHIGHIMETHRN